MTQQAVGLSPVGQTLTYLRYCRAARVAGFPVSYTTDPAWLVQMAINRRAGWPDDPTHYRGSCHPVHGRYPRKAEGLEYGHLRVIAREINTPGLVVDVARLGEHRWLAQRVPWRFEM